MMPFTRLITAPALALGLALSLPALAANTGAPLQTAVVEADLSKSKRNVTGTYITAAESIAVLAERDDVALIDVRSPEETMFVGYATQTLMNIPFKLVDPGHAFNAEKGVYAMIDNPNFISDMKAFIAANEPAALLIICRSGSRSARAVDALVEAGIETRAYTVTDGFEGDKDESGARSVNGWRNVGGDWTYEIREGLMPARQ